MIHKIGLDLGNSHLKVVYLGEDGKKNQFKIPSVVAISNEKANDLVEFDNKFYYVGADALLQPTENQICITDFSSLINNIGIILKYIEKTIGEFKEVHTGLSKSDYQSKDFLKQSITKLGYENVSVKIQGVAGLIAYIKDNPNIKNIIGLDVGGETLDIAMIQNGKERPEKRVGQRNLGTNWIGRKIITLIKNEFKRDISIKKAMEIMETKKFFLRGVNHDLTSQIKEFETKYSELLTKAIIKKYSDYLDYMEEIIFFGGGAYLIDIEQQPNFKILDNPEFVNALGYIR